MSRTRVLLLLAFLALAAALAACGDDSDDSGDDSAATASGCKPAQLQTAEEGTLTVGTDKPAFPPYFVGNDPTNGKGFESAVAYAIAGRLGYQRGDVKWTVVPFNASYAPGPKDFDFDVNQISITPDRAKQVDFSTPYYEAEQAVVALKGSGAAKAKSLDDLKDTRFGVQIGTTSLDAVNDVVQPSTEARVYDNSNDVISALKQGQVDAVVVDVPTALYLTAVQVPEATVAGQFSAPGGDTWGALLEKDSPLTACVSKAVEELKSSGELPKIEQRWMSQAAGAPVLD
ncbi:MAG TPA: ABC transporter substrate-binding protein [Solirubrobacterales bacterium]|nr:ABC transporter substrate-binding protein [Solirubrobacterales bacterium]